jgi:ABC-type sugar transport system ATPase subunit
MRASISKLHRRLGVTTVYVTHDQVEAMTMGTRIVVMKDGLIQQVDSPINLYDKPVNKFVAGFMGSPAMNFLVGTVQNGHLKSPQFDLAPNGELAQKLRASEGKKVYVGIRPENLGLRGNTAIAEGQNVIKARSRSSSRSAPRPTSSPASAATRRRRPVDSHARVAAGDQIELLATSVPARVRHGERSQPPLRLIARALARSPGPAAGASLAVAPGRPGLRGYASWRDPRRPPPGRQAPRRADRARRRAPGAAPRRAARADRPQRRGEDHHPAPARGAREPDAGEVFAAGSPSACSTRTPASTARTADPHGRRGRRRRVPDLDAMERELAALEAAGLDDPDVYARWDDLHQRFERRGGYARRARRDAVLHALGFAGREDDACARLSGGERTRLGLARLLMAQPDVLLLDEPTNHLDLAMRGWLEGFVGRYPGAASSSRTTAPSSTAPATAPPRSTAASCGSPGNPTATASSAPSRRASRRARAPTRPRNASASRPPPSA